MGRNNEDFSYGSSYWNDKSYGHEAPDGTVHPQRRADRIGDAVRSGAKVTYKGGDASSIVHPAKD